ncbi:hypothetical protein KR054_010418, partial [Drosophila jambulina]
WRLYRFLLLTLQMARAMQPFRGSCPQNMTAMKDFDMSRFLGKWYIHSKYPPIPDRIYRCQSVVFKQDNDAKFYVEKRMLSSQTDTVIFKKAEILKLEPKAGRYIQDSKNKAFPEGIQIYILDTDYENYAIRFMCFDTSTVFSFHWAVLQFRKRNPVAEDVYNAQKKARENGIKISHVVKVPQTGCPDDT